MTRLIKFKNQKIRFFEISEKWKNWRLQLNRVCAKLTEPEENIVFLKTYRQLDRSASDIG